MTRSSDPYRITRLEALEARYGAISQRSRNKVSDQLLQEHCEFIATAGFCVVASATEEFLDCSPRGDRPGEAFAVLDEHHIAMPDRRGNNRIDTLRHLLDDPRIGILFLAQGTEQALRVRGTAHVTLDPVLLSRFTLADQAPRSIIVTRVTGVMLQNTRAIRRSGLWKPDIS